MHKPIEPADLATAPITREALSVEAVAFALGVGRVTVFRLLKENQLRRVKIGRRTLVPAADVAALVERLATKEAE